MFRYAAYKHYRKEFMAGKKLEDVGFGAARPEIVEALTDPLDKAAVMARGAMGDYADMTETGQAACGATLSHSTVLDRIKYPSLRQPVPKCVSVWQDKGQGNSRGRGDCRIVGQDRYVLCRGAVIQ